MVKKVWNFIPILHISLICGKKKCCKIQRIRGRKRGSRRYYKRFQKLKLVFVDLCFCCIHGTLLTLYWDSFSLLGPYGQIPKPLWPHRLAGSRWAVGRWQRGAPSAPAGLRGGLGRAEVAPAAGRRQRGWTLPAKVPANIEGQVGRGPGKRRAFRWEGTKACCTDAGEVD